MSNSENSFRWRLNIYRMHPFRGRRPAVPGQDSDGRLPAVVPLGRASFRRIWDTLIAFDQS